MRVTVFLCVCCCACTASPDDIASSGADGTEPMSSQQVTMWLQGLFLFAVVWSVGGTINGDSRNKFDAFYRNLIMGMDDNHPRPKSVKLTKNNVFPERGDMTLSMSCAVTDNHTWTTVPKRCCLRHNFLAVLLPRVLLVLLGI